MWNPLTWFCRRRYPTPPGELGNGGEAKRARVDAERRLTETKVQSERINELVRGVTQAQSDRFAEDVRKAFGT